MSYKHCLFGVENPLLDISAHVDKEFVDKYECVFGNAILAEGIFLFFLFLEKHMSVYDVFFHFYR
jgi:hypothetical protein